MKAVLNQDLNVHLVTEEHTILYLRLIDDAYMATDEHDVHHWLNRSFREKV